MIINQRFKRPIISFGLGMTLFSCEVGDPVTVYQNEVYNDEYYLIDDEQAEVITLTYAVFGDPDTNLTADFDFVANYNSRPYYNNPTTLGANVSIFWDGAKWMMVSNFNVGTGGFVQEVGRLAVDIPKPIGLWAIGGTSVIPKVTVSNVTNYSFTFPAVETKEIQIEMKSKDGIIIPSNKINLIVT
jgi:hypothetical protein